VTIPYPVIIQSAVEGLVDEAVVQRLITHAGGLSGAIYTSRGKSALLAGLRAYNQAARHSRWAVIIDLDHDADCAPEFCAAHLPVISEFMCFRVAVREVESWLLADREQIAHFLGVPDNRVPQLPDEIADPKWQMVDLARHSRKRDIRDDLVPQPGSGRETGPAYPSRLIEFAGDTVGGWRPDVAARASDSLSRCLHCLRRLTGALA
jgi:hypothetical protein